MKGRPVMNKPSPTLDAPARNQKLVAWVSETAALCKPDQVVWCDGSREEYDAMCELLVKGGTFTRLNPDKRPNSYLARTHSSDVARVEERTFICAETQEEVGPTNNWAPSDEMRATMRKVFDGCMRGPHHVRHPVQHGSDRLAHRQDRRRDHRQPLRGGQHGHHDAYREQSARRPWARTASSFPASIRSAHRWHRGRRT